MSDRMPNYSAEALRLDVEIAEHEDTIEKGRARLLEIERKKKLNLQRAELANIDLDTEADRIRGNEEALLEKIKENKTNRDAMAKPGREA